MYTLFVIIHVLVSIVLCVAILLQNSKGGGLAGAFGGTGGAPQQLLGSRGMTTLLHKITIWYGIGFMVTSLSLFMMSGSDRAGAGSVLEEAQERGQINPDLPAPPISDDAPLPGQQPLVPPQDGESEPAPTTDGGDGSGQAEPDEPGGGGQ